MRHYVSGIAANPDAARGFWPALTSVPYPSPSLNAVSRLNLARCGSLDRRIPQVP